MGISAYYNEFDPKAAAWLRQLIKNGNITPGEVDERSITEVNANELIGFDRVHFFAGIGTWDYCLNQAGWGDKPVWTASLPCQPFSTAGKGLGKSDERHLLPHFLELVRQCKPDTIFGEQVEGAIRHGWLDDLQANMEAEGYAVGHCVLGAHSIGAAHIRQRLYWVAHSSCAGSSEQLGRRHELQGFAKTGMAGGWMGNTEHYGCITRKVERGDGSTIQNIETGEDSAGESEGASSSAPIPGHIGVAYSERGEHARGVSGYREESSKNGKWPASEFTGLGEVDWIYCRDNKYRPVKSGIKPLVDGIARGMVHGSDSGEPINANETQEARVIRLKGYGNAIQAQTAMAFISAYMSIK